MLILWLGKLGGADSLATALVLLESRADSSSHHPASLQIFLPPAPLEEVNSQEHRTFRIS